MPGTSHFEIVKEKVDLEDYLSNHLGVDIAYSGTGRAEACCPFHEENTPSFKIRDSDRGDYRTWHCFGECDMGGTVIDAVMQAENFEIANDAVRYLNDLYGLGLEMNDPDYQRFAAAVKQTRGRIEETTTALEEDERLSEIAHRYLNGRGLTNESIEHFQLGLDTKITATGRIAIPLIDKAAHPVSIAYRALFNGSNCKVCGEWVASGDVLKLKHKKDREYDQGAPADVWQVCPKCDAPDKQAKISWLYHQNPKYRFEREFEKARFLYNEHATRRVLRKDSDAIGLFVAEGYGEVWAAWIGGQPAVAYNGSSMSDWQAREMVDICSGRSEDLSRPIILVPDYDAAGLKNISVNIDHLRNHSDTQEIQVVYGIDALEYTDHLGEKKTCKDLGDVLEHFGGEKVSEVLANNRMPAAEWQIRIHVGKVNQKTGKSFHSRHQQMHLVAGVLSRERSKASIDHMIEYLAEMWNAPVDPIRSWFYSNLTADNATSYQHLIKTIEEAREEAREFLKSDNIIPLGFDALDAAMPGGGARPGQIAMILGKALSLDSKILTASGWKQMADIQIGDSVVDPDGGSGRVTGVFPQGERELFRVTFSDGASVECDREHLWLTLDSDNQERIQTLGEIIDNGDVGRSVEPNNQVYIPLTEPIEFGPEATLPIAPYILGAILGAAAERSTRALSLAPELALNEAGSVTEQSFIGAGTAVSTQLEQPSSMIRSLKDLGFENNQDFVPELYLVAAIEDRLDLLRGLLDSDNGAGSNRFSSARRRLAQAVVSLVRSLGGSAELEEVGTGSEQSYQVVFAMSARLNPYLTATEMQGWTSRAEPSRSIVSAEPTGLKPAKCITVDTKRSLYITDDFIVTHNSGTGKTMLSTQLLANMAERGIRSIFFTLEQASKSLYGRLATQVLGLPTEEVARLIISDDPEDEATLAPVNELYKDMRLIDNVPTETQKAVPMTPDRIRAMIQEVNLTEFDDRPASVVVIDYLSVLHPNDDAPREVKGSDDRIPGYNMLNLFEICKETNVFMIVLQQLPKDVKKGVPFSYDSGRGGSRQTDACDYIFCIWRPDQNEELRPEEKAMVADQYKIALGKNRYGPSTIENAILDTRTLRIMPPAEVSMPDGLQETPTIEIGEPTSTELERDPEAGVPPELQLNPSDSEEQRRQKQLIAAGDVGGSAEAMEMLADAVPTGPSDNQALLAQIMANDDEDRGEAEGEAEGEGKFGEVDPGLQRIFES